MSRDPAKRRASRQRYDQSAKGQAARQASQPRYNQSDKGQARAQRRGDKRAANKAAREIQAWCEGCWTFEQVFVFPEETGKAIACVGEKEQQDRFNPVAQVRARDPRGDGCGPPVRATQGLRWSLWQTSLNIPWDTQATGGVVGLTVQPKFLEQFPNARFHFKSGPLAQRGTFKGVWLNDGRTEWALEKEQQ
jgi:hypothetical protein